VPTQPSAEVNFALLRQFSISVSSILTPVVFGVLFLTGCIGELSLEGKLVSIISVKFTLNKKINIIKKLPKCHQRETAFSKNPHLFVFKKIHK
jgi:hypothetical protein